MSQEAERIAQDITARFAGFFREEVNPGSDARDRDAEPLARELMVCLARDGLLGLSLPREAGGGGADLFHWGVALETVGRLCDDGAVPLLLSLRAAVANHIFSRGSPGQIDAFVRPMARGELFGSFAYSDGADPFAFKSSCKRAGDGWLLNGEKLLVTGGIGADVFMTYVRDDSNDLKVFLVRRDDPGVSVAKIEVQGARAAGLATFRMENVNLAGDRMLVPHDALSDVQAFLNVRRLLLCCGPLGRMRAIRDECIVSLSQTIRYGRPLSEMQNVQASLGRMTIACEAARALAYRALDNVRAGEHDAFFDPLSAAAKCFITEQGLKVAIGALRLLGGSGYIKERRFDRYLRDFYGLLSGAGAQDILEVDLGAQAVQRASKETP